MIEGIKKIQRTCGNVSLSETTCAFKVGGDPRKTDAAGMLIDREWGAYVYDLRRIGGSYRVDDSAWYPSSQNRKPVFAVRNHDAESDVSRLLSLQKAANGTESKHALIQKEPLADVGPFCSYARYLGGFGPLEDDFYKVLIDHQSALRFRGVDQRSRLVEVAFSYKDARKQESVTGTAWLDLGKDWMLRKMRREVKMEWDPRVREEYQLFEVQGSELFDGTWLPTMFREVTWSSNIGYGSLYETIAENIKLGSVTELSQIF